MKNANLEDSINFALQTARNLAKRAGHIELAARIGHLIKEMEKSSGKKYHEVHF